MARDPQVTVEHDVLMGLSYRMSWVERQQANNTHPYSSAWWWCPRMCPSSQHRGINLMPGEEITTSKAKKWNTIILSSCSWERSPESLQSLFQSVTLILNVRMGVSMFCYSERRRKKKESQASHTQISTYPKSTKHLRKPITPQLCTTNSYTLSCPVLAFILVGPLTVYCHTHRPFVVKGSKQGQQQKTT